MRRLLVRTAIILVAVAVAIQFIPYGRDHINPPVVAEPVWANAATRAFAVRACFDCHSNQTHWAWYTKVAPISWLTQRDVDEGRQKLNFSRWDLEFDDADEAVETVIDGEMPPIYYTLAHPAARLSDVETLEFVSGLGLTLGESRERSGDGDHGDDEDDD